MRVRIENQIHGAFSNQLGPIPKYLSKLAIQARAPYGLSVEGGSLAVPGCRESHSLLSSWLFPTCSNVRGIPMIHAGQVRAVESDDFSILGAFGVVMAIAFWATYVFCIFSITLPHRIQAEVPVVAVHQDEEPEVEVIYVRADSDADTDSDDDSDTDEDVADDASAHETSSDVHIWSTVAPGRLSPAVVLPLSPPTIESPTCRLEQDESDNESTETDCVEFDSYQNISERKRTNDGDAESEVYVDDDFDNHEPKRQK